MMRFILAVAIVVAALYFFLNIDRFIEGDDPALSPAPIDAPSAPAPEPEDAPKGETESESAPESEPESESAPELESEPESEPEPEPAPDVLIDESGKTFSYYKAGDLMDHSGPDAILIDDTVYDDRILFPAEKALFLNSQQYGHGGLFADKNGKTGAQCNEENYNYPWRDNFCEKRGRNQFFCARGGHTGVDARPASCEKGVHWVVAPEDGIIIWVGSYSVRMMSDNGNWWQFLHLDMENLPLNVAAIRAGEGQRVTKGQRLGLISNYFISNGAIVPTTYHVHIDMKAAAALTPDGEPFLDRVNPYMTLVSAYERKLRAEQSAP